MALGTFLPWAEGVYGGRASGWNGWELYYQHAPHFTAALLPLSLAVAAVAVAGIGDRRPYLLRLAVAPGLLTGGFVAFTYTTYAGGLLGASLRSVPGYSSSRLGLGFWMMALGAVLVTAAGIGADDSPPHLLSVRLSIWLMAAAFEFALLWVWLGSLVLVCVVVSAIVGLGYALVQSVRPGPAVPPRPDRQLPPSSDGLTGSRGRADSAFGPDTAGLQSGEGR